MINTKGDFISMEEKKNKKKFVNPDMEIIEFTNEDIITLSGQQTLFWGGGDNEETF